MILKLFNYTLEVYLSKSNCNRRIAKALLDRYWLNPSSNSHKIGLIKLIRSEQDMSLVDAKEAIEAMYDFPDYGRSISIK